MFECEKCGSWFRDRYNLKQHESRKKPCVLTKIKDENRKDENIAPNSTFLAPNSTFFAPNSNFKENENKCVYCFHDFKKKWNKNKHEKICKHRNEIRDLEIELDIEPDFPDCKTTCRFCNKNLCRTDALKKHTCNERITYHNILLKQQEKKKNETSVTINNINNTINNGTIHNGNVNNIINVFGSPRSLGHIEVERIIQFLRDLKHQRLSEQTYDQAGELVIMMENYIQENPSNRNVIIPDYKSPICYVKQENDWGIKGVDGPLSQQFKETAGIIYNKKEEIDNVNEKVFQNNTNCEIFNHVRQFNNKGFNHVMYGEQKMKVIKSNYKITKLKNKSICDF
jgi:hypothetical protein